MNVAQGGPSPWLVSAAFKHAAARACSVCPHAAMRPLRSDAKRAHRRMRPSVSDAAGQSAGGRWVRQETNAVT